MWLAFVMYCTTTDVMSCRVMANTENLHYSEEACMEDSTSVATALVMQRMYAIAGCFELGESA